MRTLSTVTEHTTHNTNCFVSVVLYVLYSVRMEKDLIHISNFFRMLNRCQTIMWYNNFTFAHYIFKFMGWLGTILRSQGSVISLSLGRKTKQLT